MDINKITLLKLKLNIKNADGSKVKTKPLGNYYLH